LSTVTELPGLAIALEPAPLSAAIAKRDIGAPAVAIAFEPAPVSTAVVGRDIGAPAETGGIDSGAPAGTDVRGTGGPVDACSGTCNTRRSLLVPLVATFALVGASDVAMRPIPSAAMGWARAADSTARLAGIDAAAMFMPGGNITSSVEALGRPAAGIGPCAASADTLVVNSGAECRASGGGTEDCNGAGIMSDISTSAGNGASVPAARCVACGTFSM
jgi:hypothetical protein